MIRPIIARVSVGIAIAALLLGGCTATPSSRVTVRVRDLSNPAARRAAANRFWLRANVPDLRGAGYKRIAIAEFVVEFVREKRELTADLEDYAARHADDRKRATGQTQSIDVRYPNEFDFPPLLYKLFCEDLTARDLEVVPVSDVVSAAAYGRFETEPDGTTVRPSDDYGLRQLLALLIQWPTH